MIKNITNTLKIIVLAGLLSLGLSVAYAWQGPTLPPPDGNTPTPINVSNVTQTKTGGFNILGPIGIGTANPSGLFDVYGTNPASVVTRAGSTCNAGETPLKYQTVKKTCFGGNGGQSCTTTNCTTGSHTWSTTRKAVETCEYTKASGSFNNRVCAVSTCSATEYVQCAPAAKISVFSVDDTGSVSLKGAINAVGTISAGGDISTNSGYDPNYDYGQIYLKKWGLINSTGDIYIEPAPGKNITLTPYDWVKAGTLTSKFAVNNFDGDVHANDFYITKIGKWVSELSGSTTTTTAPAGLSVVSHDSSLSGDGTVSSPLSVAFNISKVKQVIAKADALGNFAWTEVVNSSLSQASALGAIDTGWRTVSLTGGTPVLGVKISGSTDEGGVCMINFPGYFSAALSLAYPVTSLGLDGSYTLGSWGGSFGNFTAGEWIFEETNSGFHVDSSAVSSAQVVYNKPVGLDFIPYTDGSSKVTLNYRQVYSNTNGPGGNVCKVSVLYGNIVL